MANFSATTDFVSGNVIASAEMNTNFGDLETRYDILRLLHSGSGTNTTAVSSAPTADQVMDTHTLAVNDLAADDELVIKIEIEDVSSGAGVEPALKLTDGSGSATISQITDKKTHQNTTFYLLQRLTDNTNVDGYSLLFKADNTHAFSTRTFGLTDTNVISTALQIDLVGGVDTGGTMYYRWWIYKRDNE